MSLLRSALEKIEADDPVRLSGDEQLDRLDELLGAFDWLQALIARETAAIEASGAYLRDGYTSPAALVRHRGKVNPGTAGQVVALSRVFDRLEAVATAWLGRKLTTTQTRILVAAHQESPEELERDQEWLVGTVAGLTPEDTSKAVAYWRQAAAPEIAATEHEKLRTRRRLSAARTLHGAVHIEGLFDPEAGETILAALEAATPPPRMGDDRSPTQRRADALTDLARSYLSGNTGGSGGRPEVLVHVDLHTLAGLGTSRPVHETARGEVLSPETLRRIACDAAIRRLVLSPEGLPLDLGRRTRTIPAWLRVVVLTRDRHCIFPGCDRPPEWCDVHHIRFWGEGGETNLENLVVLCRYHHTLVHEGGFQMTGVAHDLTIYRPDGSVLHKRHLDPPLDRAPP